MKFIFVHEFYHRSICVMCCVFSHLVLSDSLVTPWTVAYQAPRSMGYPMQEYWNGFPFPPLGDLLDPGMAPMSPALQTNCLLTEPPGKTYQSMYILLIVISAATFDEMGDFLLNLIIWYMSIS